MTEGNRQFIDEVFPAELQEIRRRRAALDLDDEPLRGAPSTRLGLVGLALSGGGIRSATFGLGVLQGLARRGVLRQVDYLSTVSGGGFVGACVSSVLNTQGTGPDQARFPLGHEPGVVEPVAVRHLRNSGNYLASGSLTDRLRIPTLFLRGILINLFMLLPYVMLAVVLTELVYYYTQGTGWVYRTAPLAAVGAFLLLVVTFPFVSRAFRSRFDWTRRNRYEVLLTVALFAFFLTVVLVPFVLVVNSAIEQTWTEFRSSSMALVREPFQLARHWPWLAVMGMFLLFMLAGHASERVTRWTGKALLVALGLLGPVFLLGIYLLLVVIQVGAPVLDARFAEDFDRGVLTPYARSVLADKGVTTSPAARIEVLEPGARWAVVDGEKTYPVKREDARRLTIDSRAFWDGHSDWIFFGVAAVLVLFDLFFLDVNITSVHGFYRDRLSRAYLVRLAPDGTLLPNDEQRLSDLNGPGTTAPYHLINATLNVPGSEDPDLRGRNADFFVFSKRFTGGPRTGFCRTEQLEGVDRHLNVATAVAISGAAAAPNMGVTTIRPLVFIMTMLNIRLGYWLPNPRTIAASHWYQRLLLPSGAGPRYLWREATGRVGELDRYVNVSDGGHLENLGVYELMRRRCRLIIAVDGECDPLLTFGALVQLVRFALIDMGVKISIDLDAVRLGPDGRSRTHWALGTIDYGRGEIGHLVYVKSSLTGDENEYVRDYRSHFPLYPHEPTTDQFFDETQFEVYRALGHHIATRVVDDPHVRDVFKEVGLV